MTTERKSVKGTSQLKATGSVLLNADAQHDVRKRIDVAWFEIDMSKVELLTTLPHSEAQVTRKPKGTDKVADYVLIDSDGTARTVVPIMKRKSFVIRMLSFVRLLAVVLLSSRTNSITSSRTSSITSSRTVV